MVANARVLARLPTSGDWTKRPHLGKPGCVTLRRTRKVALSGKAPGHCGWVASPARQGRSGPARAHCGAPGLSRWGSFILPEWQGLPRWPATPGGGTVQIPVGEVERRSLEVYNWLPWEAQGDRAGTGAQTPGVGLKQSVEALDNSLDTAASKQPRDAGRKPAGSGVLATRSALPAHQFDFGLPALHRLERHVRELADLAFVAEASNILLMGPPGWGRPIWPYIESHREWRYFVRAYDLMEDLRQGQGGITTWTVGCGSTWRPRCFWMSSASGPTTGNRPPPSSRWCRPGTSGAASSSHPTRASVSGANSSRPRHPPRRSSTGRPTHSHGVELRGHHRHKLDDGLLGQNHLPLPRTMPTTTLLQY